MINVNKRIRDLKTQKNAPYRYLNTNNKYYPRVRPKRPEKMIRSYDVKAYKFPEKIIQGCDYLWLNKDI